MRKVPFQNKEIYFKVRKPHFKLQKALFKWDLERNGKKQNVLEFDVEKDDRIIFRFLFCLIKIILLI